MNPTLMELQKGQLVSFQTGLLLSYMNPSFPLLSGAEQLPQWSILITGCLLQLSSGCSSKKLWRQCQSSRYHINTCYNATYLETMSEFKISNLTVSPVTHIVTVATQHLTHQYKCHILDTFNTPT